MPRKPLERSNCFPYHVNARVNNRESFPISLAEQWRIFEEECLLVSVIYGAEFHGFVLMPNHFHALITVPEHDLGKLMSELMKSVSRRTHLISGRSGHLFGGRYHPSIIKDTRYFAHALKYVYRNPVRAGLCGRVEDYSFSTLQGLLGTRHLGFPLYHTRLGLEVGLPGESAADWLEWLNRPFPSEAERLIRKGLRKSEFATVLDRTRRKPIESLNQRI